ncbi:MAG: hypothetical protein AAB791_00845 [Patescibacteria group bacterium]
MSKNRDIRSNKRVRPKREEKKVAVVTTGAKTEEKKPSSSRRQVRGTVHGTRTTWAVKNAKERKKRNREIKEEARRTGASFETIKFREEAKSFGVSVEILQERRRKEAEQAEHSPSARRSYSR